LNLWGKQISDSDFPAESATRFPFLGVCVRIRSRLMVIVIVIVIVIVMVMVMVPEALR
jgi:hypothetical protein